MNKVCSRKQNLFHTRKFSQNLISSSNKTLFSTPRYCSVSLIILTIFLNSSGNSETLWSGPKAFRSKLKCFSITSAPIATAKDGTKVFNEWSENPILKLGNSFLKNLIVFRFSLLGGQG